MRTVSDDRVLIVQRRIDHDKQPEPWVDHRQLPEGTSIEYAEILMSRMPPPAPEIRQRLIERCTVITEEVLA